MAVRPLFWFASFTLLIGCGQAVDPNTAGAGLVELLPTAAALDGWSIEEDPVEYSPDTLYEYLDGGAPLYLDYGFQRLAQGRYRMDDGRPSGITIDIFDMGSPLGAFGIYASIRPPEAALRPRETEGYRSGTVAAAWRGDVYVHGEADDDSPELIEALERLMAETSAGLTGDASWPAILAALPADGLVHSSERFVATDLLGHAFLPGGILATYEIEGREVHLFFSDLGSEAAATRGLADLRAHEARRGEIVGGSPTFGAAGFRFSDPGMGTGTAVAADRFVAGVYGDLPHDSQEGLLERLVTRLAPSASGD